jgi:N-acetylglucosaminyl-diphospho-decaprenol L-rhamnosyltransferase
MARRLSVVVVTHNSRAAVAAALPALWEQLADGDDLIVVDNASADGTLETVRAIAPAATIIETGYNAGFAAAANAGARAASGELLVFLNPDARPAPGFVDAIRASGYDAWMGLVTAGDGMNSGGGVLHFTGIAWAGQTTQREPAFLSGACLAVPRERFEAVGGFAADYFLYHEDVDLSLRLRLTGARLGVEPAAVVDHDYEFAKGAAKWRYLERNRWATIARCYPPRLLALLAPALLATELALLVVAATGGWLPQKLAATGETLRALPRLLRERRTVQATRTITDREFAAWLTPDLDSPFLGRAAQLGALRWGLRAYWRLVLRAL